MNKQYLWPSLPFAYNPPANINPTPKQIFTQHGYLFFRERNMVKMLSFRVPGIFTIV